MQLILISGLSGSGKSVALKALEDNGFFCVDNLPATMLVDAISIYQRYGYTQIAISVDTRTQNSLGALPDEMQNLKALQVDVRLLFLEAKREVLVQRFSETRRSHPLFNGQRTIEECILREQELFENITELGTRIDTSDLKSNDLKTWIKQFVLANSKQLTLIFESFGFKHSLPLDADFVFDVRCLPNPYYDTTLRALTGKDAAIQTFFAQHSDVEEMIVTIEEFLNKWLPKFDDSNRSYLTIAIGCTGGQHRSVYIAEMLAQRFSDYQVLLRHRQLSSS